MFDPYHKWLGIPKDQRPPTFYQLLGITAGEEDVEVIEEAAIRQTTHVRAYQIGPHSQDCTRLLNEISQARSVLTNPAKRKQYDATLAQKTKEKVASMPGPANQVTSSPPGPKAAEMFADLDSPDLIPAGKKPPTKIAPASSKKGLIYLAAGGGVAAVLAIVLIVVLSGKNPPNNQQVHNPDKVKAKDKQIQKKNQDKNAKKDDDKKGGVVNQEDMELAAKIVGRYLVTHSGSVKTHWQFTIDRKAIQDGTEKGTWQVENGRVVITYTPPWERYGEAVLEFKDANTLEGKNTHRNGRVFKWVVEREAAAVPVVHWTFANNAKDSIRGVEGTLQGGAKVVNGWLQLDGKKACLITKPLPVDLGPRTLEIWLTVGNLAQSDAGVLQIVDGGGLWDGILYATKKPGNWYPGSSYNHRSAILDGPMEDAKPGELVQIIAVYRADNSISLYRNGKIYGSTFTPAGQGSQLRTYKKGDAFLVVGSNGGSLQFFNGGIAEVRVYDVPLNEEEIAHLFRSGRPERSGEAVPVVQAGGIGLVVKEEIDCSQPPRFDVGNRFRLDKDWRLSLEYQVPALEKERLLLLWGNAPFKKSPLFVQHLGKFMNVTLTDASNPKDWVASQVELKPGMVGKWIRIQYDHLYSKRAMVLDLGEGAKNNWILGFTPKLDSAVPFWIGGDPASPRFQGRIRNVRLENVGDTVSSKEKVGPIAGPSPLDKLDPDKIAAADRLEKTPELVAVLKGPKSEIFGLAFSPDSKKLACACNEGQLYFWDVADGKTGEGIPLGPMGGSLCGLAFSADNKRLVCANQRQARIYDVTSTQPKGIQEIQLNVVQHPWVAWSPDGSIVAVTDRAGVRLLDWIQGKERPMLRFHYGDVRTVYFSRDGSMLLSACLDKTAKVWNMKTDPPKEKFTLKGTDSLWHAVFSPDGKQVAAGGFDGMVQLWDISGPKPELRWSKKEHRQWANSVCFAPDGRTLISTEGGGNPRGPHYLVWWNAADGEVIKKWELPERCSQGVFAPSGMYVALTNHNRKVYILRLKAE